MQNMQKFALSTLLMDSGSDSEFAESRRRSNESSANRGTLLIIPNGSLRNNYE